MLFAWITKRGVDITEPNYLTEIHMITFIDEESADELYELPAKGFLIMITFLPAKRTDIHIQ